MDGIYSDRENEIMEGFEVVLDVMIDFYRIKYKTPVRNIAMRLLEEVAEFEPAEEVRRSSLRPWEKG